MIEKNLISGTTPMLVLSLLKDGDKYGYEMLEEMAKRSDNTFRFKEGTLYPLLHSLENENYVKSYTKDSPSGRPRKYYHLTKSGRAQLEHKTLEWKLFTEKVNLVLNPAGERCFT